MTTKGEEEESEPQGWALHDEPSNRWRYGGTPSGTVVFTVRSLEEFQKDGGWWAGENKSEETVSEEGFIGDFFHFSGYGIGERSDLSNKGRINSNWRTLIGIFYFLGLIVYCK